MNRVYNELFRSKKAVFRTLGFQVQIGRDVREGAKRNQSKNELITIRFFLGLKKTI
jgi:hypothetical protein